MDKKVRNVTAEHKLAEAAAQRDVLDTMIVDLPAIKRAAYAHGYAKALMDVADGAVKPPKPKWEGSR